MPLVLQLIYWTNPVAADGGHDNGPQHTRREIEIDSRLTSWQSFCDLAARHGAWIPLSDCASEQWFHTTYWYGKREWFSTSHSLLLFQRAGRKGVSARRCVEAIGRWDGHMRLVLSWQVKWRRRSAREKKKVRESVTLRPIVRCEWMWASFSKVARD